MSEPTSLWNPAQRQRAHGVETRNHKGSKAPMSSLSASDDTGVTYYLRRLQDDRRDNLEKAKPFIVNHLVSKAPEYNWRSTRETYAGIAEIAIRKMIGEHFTHKQIAHELGVSVDAVRCHSDKIDEALVYVMRMYRS